MPVKINYQKVGVIIPCYKVSKHIANVIKSIPAKIAHIIIVDDACPENSGKIASKVSRKNLHIIYRKKNGGVGAAMAAGFEKAIQLKLDVVVKIDGDGQMDASQIDKFILPIAKNRADYVKGNRFENTESIRKMPFVRLFGNSLLSFFVKLASGYWNIFDPTNGYTAVRVKTLQKLKLNKIPKGYFYESGMLIRLNIINAVVKDVNLPAIYGDENSSLKISKVIVQFPFKLFFGFAKRILLKYFIYNFNMASVYLLLGLPVFVISIVSGAYFWIKSIKTGIPSSAGTIMLVALPIIISFQMLLQALNIDINSVPEKTDEDNE
ncbi:MAG: glycosyltransferase family 2 protein [Spirochaetia bacterium]|nr:glycosyltransferase family 2 protein [Spirochaetia bacterium]